MSKPPTEFSSRIDLHSHSTFSDGQNSAEAMYQRAVALRLAAYALTDHNTLDGVLHLLRQKDLLVRHHPDASPELPWLVPGVEYSFRKGHFLAYGPELGEWQRQLEKWQIPPGSTRYRQSWREIEDCLQWTVDQGGTVIVAHPGLPLGVLSVGLDKLVELWGKGLIHGAEFHNHSLERKLSRFSRLWAATVGRVLTKHGIPAFAFSDAHRTGHLAGWVTAVPEPEQALNIKRLVDPQTPRAHYQLTR